jgi:hypothetical protein
MKKLLVLGMALVLAATLAGCGGGDDDRIVVTGPGFVGIDDSTTDTAPLLTVDFVDPILGPGTALILSDGLGAALNQNDILSDGDIAFDAVRSLFSVTTNTSTLFFGIDSLDPNLPEFRGFITFPLDGFEGRDVVPSAATITNATMELLVTSVEFSSVIPTFLDLVRYEFRNLVAGDFNATVIDSGTLEFLSSDRIVVIDVTPLMETAQAGIFPDFQVRLTLDGGASSLAGTKVARPQGTVKKLGRTVSSTSSAVKRPERTPRAGGSSAVPGAERPARSR